MRGRKIQVRLSSGELNLLSAVVYHMTSILEVPDLTMEKFARDAVVEAAKKHANMLIEARRKAEGKLRRRDAGIPGDSGGDTGESGTREAIDSPVLANKGDSEDVPEGGQE